MSLTRIQIFRRMGTLVSAIAVAFVATACIKPGCSCSPAPAPEEIDMGNGLYVYAKSSWELDTNDGTDGTVPEPFDALLSYQVSKYELSERDSELFHDEVPDSVIGSFSTTEHIEPDDQGDHVEETLVELIDQFISADSTAKPVAVEEYPNAELPHISAKTILDVEGTEASARLFMMPSESEYLYLFGIGSTEYSTQFQSVFYSYTTQPEDVSE